MPIVDPFEEKKGIVDPFDDAASLAKAKGNIKEMGEGAPSVRSYYAKVPVRFGMEGLGSFGGGLLGGAVGGVPGAIAGETAGYAAGSELADVVLGEDTGGIPQKLIEGAAFSVIPRGVEYIGRGLVRSALKIPPTQVKPAGAKKVVDTIIKERLPVSDSGVKRAGNIIKEIEGSIDDVLKSSGSKVQVDDIVKTIDANRTRFQYDPDVAEINGVFDDVVDKLRNHPKASSGEIPLAEAQQMKKALYRKLDKFYKNIAKLEPDKQLQYSAKNVAEASEAEGFKKAIMSDPSVPPDAMKWLERESNIINAKKWIMRRTNVGANMDPITFNDVLLGGLIREGVPYAIAVRFLRMPAIQSRIGIALAKSKPALQYGGIAAKDLLTE